MRTKIDKEKATQLRQQGLTYKEVADAMGCSLVWCKINLKDVKQVSDDSALITAIRTQGRTPQGITQGEIKAMVKDRYPSMLSDELESKIKDIKKAARRGSKDVVIRPYWMIPDAPVETMQEMMQMAQEVYELKNHLATKFRRLFDLDDSYQKNITYYLTMLAAGDHNKLMPQGLKEFGVHLETLAETLAGRNEGASTQYIPCPHIYNKDKVYMGTLESGLDVTANVSIPESEVPY